MEKLIADVEQDALNTAFMTGVKHIDKRVLDAMRSIDRKAFVRPQDQSLAYIDVPLEIGHGQTISQPFIVALMLHLIEPKMTDKVLEIGAGSGYVVAVLAKLCELVFGVEVIPELAQKAKETLVKEHVTNATIVCGDGNLGLLERAPFDKIIVSAAAHKLPPMLLDQLRIGGIMVLPRSTSLYDQMLIRLHKTSPTEFKMMDILPVRFVPLVNS
jgi:protein-L-isoaspartate(D-aspartate) O-methyltransferase